MHRRGFLVLAGAAAARVNGFAAVPARLAAESEPGSRIVVSGRILAADGKSPAAGVRLFLYHTDAAGYYSRPNNESRNSRIRGEVFSAADGSYAFETIRPANYAEMERPPAAHIHVHVAGKSIPDHWIDTYLFADDKRLPEAEREKYKGLDRFSAVMAPLGRAGNRVQFARDIRLNPELYDRNRLVNGWYR